MRTLSSKLLALLGGMTLAAASTLAQDSGALLDLLVKKGMITDQEAEQLRADLTKDFVANTPAGKLNLGSGLTELRISGDVRARFEDRVGTLPTGDNSERDRFRYRFRTSLTGKVLNDWSFGVRLETGAGSRSSNVTMGDDAGPFAKTSDTVNIGQIYLQWTPSPEFNLTVGRMPNPLVSTIVTWDADINPEGLAEQFKRRDGKIEYSATLGQFLYSGASTQNTFGTAANVQDLFMFAWQGGLKVYTGEGTADYFQVNPTLYNYYHNTPQNPAAFRGSFTSTNGAPVNNLFVFDMPLEYDWVSNGVPMRAFGDFAYNFDGKARARKFGRPDLDGDVYAWQAGFQFGKAVNKGEWDAKVFYQSVGAFAVDPNLVDSDIFDSRVNMQGFVFVGNYALGSATQLTLTFGQGKRVNSTIVAPGAGDIGSNNLLDKFSLFQLDLNLKY